MAHDDSSLNEMIRKAGWFKGSSKQWESLPHEERKNLAFAALGCEVAYATWSPPVNCAHIGCRIRRGELPKIAETNHILRSEIHSGWLRFHKDDKNGRRRLAQLVRAVRRKAVETGIYDPWKLPGGWQAIVGAALSD